MRFLRNPEVRWVVWPNLLIAAASGFLLYRMASGGASARRIVLAAGIAFGVALLEFLVVSAVHSRKIGRFTQRVENNLHGHRDLQFGDFREGDYAVLQSAISDMVIAHFQQEDLLQKDKMQLMQAMADISHQINTPLSAITLTAKQLSSADMEPAQRRELVRRMLDLVERIRGFVTTLLKMSQLDAAVIKFRKDKFTAQELIDKVVDPLEMSIELREQTLVRNIPPEIVIEGDPGWLAEALLNVLKNCMEHTPVQGTLTITVTDNAVFTCITIRDTGPGIAPEDLPHIFERYYTGREAGSKSTSIGIGLAFTKMVIGEMGGTIQAENCPDGGAQFTIYLFKVNV